MTPDRFTIRLLPSDDVPLDGETAAIITMRGEHGRIAVLRQHEAVTEDGAVELMRAGTAMTREHGGPFDAVLVLPPGVGFEVYEVERAVFALPSDATVEMVEVGKLKHPTAGTAKP